MWETVLTKVFEQLTPHLAKLTLTGDSGDSLESTELFFVKFCFTNGMYCHAKYFSCIIPLQQPQQNLNTNPLRYLNPRKALLAFEVSEHSGTHPAVYIQRMPLRFLPQNLHYTSFYKYFVPVI